MTVCTINILNCYCIYDVDLIEVLQRAKTNSVNVSSKSSQESSDDRSEEITNPMASSGVDQLLARMLSSAGIVDKTIAPPSANRFLPSPATIEEIAGTYICNVCVLYVFT